PAPFLTLRQPKLRHQIEVPRKGHCFRESFRRIGCPYVRRQFRPPAQKAFVQSLKSSLYSLRPGLFRPPGGGLQEERRWNFVGVSAVLIYEEPWPLSGLRASSLPFRAWSSNHALFLSLCVT